MITVSTADWPLVTMEVDNLSTLAHMEDFVAQLENLLTLAEEQSGKFGLIYIAHISYEGYKYHSQDKATKKLSKQYFKANKERIAQQCVAIAAVTKSSILMKLLKPMARVTVKRTWGAPCDIFFTTEEAEAWLLKKITVA